MIPGENGNIETARPPKRQEKMRMLGARRAQRRAGAAHFLEPQAALNDDNFGVQPSRPLLCVIGLPKPSSIHGRDPPFRRVNLSERPCT